MFTQATLHFLPLFGGLGQTGTGGCLVCECELLRLMSHPGKADHGEGRGGVLHSSSLPYGNYHREIATWASYCIKLEYATLRYPFPKRVGSWKLSSLIRKIQMPIVSTKIQYSTFVNRLAKNEAAIIFVYPNLRTKLRYLALKITSSFANDPTIARGSLPRKSDATPVTACNHQVAMQKI